MRLDKNSWNKKQRQPRETPQRREERLDKKIWDEHERRDRETPQQRNTRLDKFSFSQQQPLKRKYLIRSLLGSKTFRKTWLPGCKMKPIWSGLIGSLGPENARGSHWGKTWWYSKRIVLQHKKPDCTPCGIIAAIAMAARNLPKPLHEAKISGTNDCSWTY